MALANFKPAKQKVAYPGGEFEVRAVSLQDVAILIDSHRYAMDQIAAAIRTMRSLEYSDSDVVAETIMEVIRESPVLVANIISMCSDEPDQQENASRLPITVQAEALEAIGNLTFTDAAAVKKFVAGAMKLVQGILPPTTVALAAE